MNYLAHIALSGTSPEIIMGNFSGDYIKGKLDSSQKKSFPEAFINGVRLHRFIDNFTDTDDTVKMMVKEVCHTYGRAAAVAIDICFDHFLARDFSLYYEQDLRSFVSGFYEVYEGYCHLVPPAFKPLAEALISNDWLYRYKEWITVERTFASMGKRYPFLSELSNPALDTRSSLGKYHEYFAEFYPRLQQAATSQLIEITNNLSGTYGDLI